MSTPGAPEVIVRPATPADWPDVERVLRDCADARRCWCAYWYLPNRDFRAGWGEGNARVLRDRVEAGLQPGVLAYAEAIPGAMAGDDRAAPVGWAGVAPRTDFDRLRRSKPLAPVDRRPAWAITCFVVRKAWRRRGLMRPLLRGALAHALARGAQVVEGYPVDADRPSHWDLFLGSPAAFREAGFEEVARRLPRRPIFRYTAPGA